MLEVPVDCGLSSTNAADGPMPAVRSNPAERTSATCLVRTIHVDLPRLLRDLERETRRLFGGALSQ